jgi:hypothetical protein
MAAAAAIAGHFVDIRNWHARIPVTQEVKS